jgi:hypothetical protein
MQPLGITDGEVCMPDPQPWLLCAQLFTAFDIPDNSKFSIMEV